MEEQTQAVQTFTIQTDGGLLTTSPTDLLQHFLPDAKPYQGSDRIFEGHAPGQNKPCYVQREALIGMLMEAREKHINPISGMYLIPSTAPDRPASHKIKYTEGVQRARLIPGFLGLNSGLIVQRGEMIAETAGSVVYPGDKILGAWAELYIANIPRPLRQEVSKSEFWGQGQQWDRKGGFMLCKVALDHLLRRNFPTLFAMPEDPDDEEALLLLTAEMPALPSLSAPAVSSQEAEVIDDDAPITRAEQKHLFALCREMGISPEDFRIALKEMYSYDNTSDIRHEDYDLICAAITDRTIAAWIHQDYHGRKQPQAAPADAFVKDTQAETTPADTEPPEPGSDG